MWARRFPSGAQEEAKENCCCLYSKVKCTIVKLFSTQKHLVDGAVVVVHSEYAVVGFFSSWLSAEMEYEVEPVG